MESHTDTEQRKELADAHSASCFRFGNKYVGKTDQL